MNEVETILSEDVLIIEDEKDLCYLLSIFLRKNNFHCKCVNSLNEAQKTIEVTNPAIIFLDNHLPDGYGSDFISTLKHLLPFAKIVMITAYDSPFDINVAFNCGADYFISKPFNSNSIRTTLDLLKLDFKESFSQLST